MIDKPVSQQIDDIISLHPGWKAQTLSRLRAAITTAHSGITEEVKWKMASRPEGLPVWSCDGIVCFAETWKDNIKLLFPKGSELNDPKQLFNTRLQSAANRGIELREGDEVDEAALKALVVEAVSFNAAKTRN